ncbi:hypothetical protein [Massilia sp. 9096]|uniref:hypothetical protein n=1 Tax=Massilia sp. 9096 TaxID=1500894 RepID=UPI0012E043D1|nr:hypothetical protein [Massilia sp. 9096]
MKPSESVKAFEDFASAKGVNLRVSTPRAGIQAMLEFQAEVTCAACSEDLLLYEWGTYDWGSGKYFELAITRQFIEAQLDDDDAISQLSLIYKYVPRHELEILGVGNQWQDGPADFRQFISGSASFALVADAIPDQVEISHSYV